jgi:hypothetical protein
MQERRRILARTVLGACVRVRASGNTDTYLVNNVEGGRVLVVGACWNKSGRWKHSFEVWNLEGFNSW